VQLDEWSNLPWHRELFVRDPDLTPD